MRLVYSIRNLLVAWISQLLIICATFIARILFVEYLGEVYLGINGLFTSIISMLTITELGIGAAIDYALYKPLADKDEVKIKLLVNLYKKVYRTIGCIIGLLGVCIIPFLDMFMADTSETANITDIRLCFIAFLVNVVLGYFFSYKSSLIIADQQAYIDKLNYCSWFFLMTIVQILSLKIYQSYRIYLLIQIVFTSFQGITITLIVDRKYPFLKKNINDTLAQSDLYNLKQNTIALVTNKIGSVIVNATDNLIISKYVGLVITGIYSNYYSIISAFNMLLSQISGAVVASVGNFNLTASRKEVEKLYFKLVYLNHILQGVLAIYVYVMLSIFIQLCFGERFVLDEKTLLVCATNFYLNGMRVPSQFFKNALGLHWHERYKPIFEVIINLSFSLIFVDKWGLMGVFLGTTLSILLVGLWFEPYVLFKYGFKNLGGIKKYFCHYLYYVLTLFFVSKVMIACFSACSISMWGFALNSFLFLAIGIVLLVLFTLKMEEYHYYKTLLLNIIGDIIKK